MFFSHPSYLQLVDPILPTPNSVLFPSLGFPICNLSCMRDYIMSLFSDIVDIRYNWENSEKIHLDTPDNITRKFRRNKRKSFRENWPRRIWEYFWNANCGTSMKIPRILAETHSRKFRKKIAPKEIAENSKYYAYTHPRKLRENSLYHFREFFRKFAKVLQKRFGCIPLRCI